MPYRFLSLTVFLLLAFSNLVSTTEIYDYQNSTELIDRINDEIEEKELADLDERKIRVNYSNDFIISNTNKLYFQAKNTNLETYAQKKELNQLRVFAMYKSLNTKIGFGNYRPVFGLGNIYKQSSSRDYLPRARSSSNFDLQGIFASYQYLASKVQIIYSKNDLNTILDSEGKSRIVYYEAEKKPLEQLALMIKYKTDKLELGLLAAQFSTNRKLEQLANKENFLIFSNYLNYHLDNLDFSYEVDYEFADLTHKLQTKFSHDQFISTWEFQLLPNHSLNWFNSGISNKYNSNTKIFAGECSFPFSKLAFTLGSELKSNKKINHWRSKSYVETKYISRFSYKLQEEIYRDYQATKHEKYTHNIKVELFSFANANISLNYTLNNKKNSSIANMYQIEYSHKFTYGKLKLNLKVLDNYKNEEIVEDIEANVIATFYEYAEDCLIFMTYQTPTCKNFQLKSSLIHSLYNNKLNSLKIELNYLL